MSGAPQRMSSGLIIPVAGIQPSQLVDTFTEARSEGRVHEAIDIMAPAGTPVLAAVDGPVAKLFTSARGGLTIYQYDGDARRVYYYAHLQSYAPGLAEGQALRQGQLIGFVGSSGDASPTAPHLHFTVGDLGPDKKWWQSTALNPYPLLVR
ncbi:M23 family metallopeptidase [Lysobacter lacus]|uniref:M23 family metallopeptidase n=2 Tax=Cognatilysobacter lacus TaxID=1643323 RepID=A0A5D8YE51_9GAMM|nr:M23 family metallopeptidase [Lysobacter lacus]